MNVVGAARNLVVQSSSGVLMSTIAHDIAIQGQKRKCCSLIEPFRNQTQRCQMLFITRFMEPVTVSETIQGKP